MSWPHDDVATSATRRLLTGCQMSLISSQPMDAYAPCCSTSAAYGSIRLPAD